MTTLTRPSITWKCYGWDYYPHFPVRRTSTYLGNLHHVLCKRCKNSLGSEQQEYCLTYRIFSWRHSRPRDLSRMALGSLLLRDSSTVTPWQFLAGSETGNVLGDQWLFERFVLSNYYFPLHSLFLGITDLVSFHVALWKHRLETRWSRDLLSRSGLESLYSQFLTRCQLRTSDVPA